jgi:hypothetical protein
MLYQTEPRPDLDRQNKDAEKFHLISPRLYVMIMRILLYKQNRNYYPVAYIECEFGAAYIINSLFDSFSKFTSSFKTSNLS